MEWYVRLLSRQPWVVLLVSGLISSIAIICSLTLKDFPNFENPQEGFEARGTWISDRLTTWENLLDSVSHIGPLITNPHLGRALAARDKRRRKNRKRNKKNNKKNRKSRAAGDEGIDDPEQISSNFTSRNSSHMANVRNDLNKNEESDTISTNYEDVIDMESEDLIDIDSDDVIILEQESVIGLKPSLSVIKMRPELTRNVESVANAETVRLEEWRSERSRRELAEPVLSNSGHLSIGWLCGDPMADFSHVVYQSVSGASLFTLESIVSMCTLESHYLKALPQYSQLCETKGPADCCPGWSLGGYIALLYNRTSCFSIRKSDVEDALTLLRKCVRYYQDGTLTRACGAGAKACRGIPQYCTRYNAVYTILHFLTDSNFLSQDALNYTKLTYSMSFLPLARSSATLEFYGNLDGKQICDGVTEIVAMDFGLKDTLFNDYLVQDANYLLFALLLIFLSVWIFTASLTLTLASLSAIGAALGTAYFIYTFILNLKFFPFMNVLASIIALGVGADDTFILVKVWSQQQHHLLTDSPSKPCLEDLVRSTLQHAALSMLVTSVTTAAAFFGSFISDITAIKCFSIFAGTTILCNLILMVTWVPAWVVLHHKIVVMRCFAALPHLPDIVQPASNAVTSVSFSVANWVTSFFEETLPCIIVRPRGIWIVSLGSLVICSMVALFHYPGLKLPDTNEIQLLTSDHPFEKYDMIFKNKFGFEKAYDKTSSLVMPLRFVWGVLPEDNGNHLNPGDKGTLVMDPSFDVTTKDAQNWLYRFCSELKKQDFYQYIKGDLLLSNCFIQTFKDWMSRACDNLVGENHRPCCRESNFPYEKAVFDQCLLIAIEDLFETPSDLWLPGVAGPKFDINSKNVSVVIIEFDSKQLFSFGYTEIDAFYNSVEIWFQSQLGGAPPELKNGFFISYLDFYDLQKSLQHGTFIAIGVAMLISFLVLFISTQNFALSLFAILTVISIIFVTVGVLVILGWKLNILESIVITLSIGLSVDFTLHYGIMYKLANAQDRDKSVIYSVSTMASPVAMGAFTTFCAGICLLPTRLVAYIQIGTFIIVLMITSWLFSTFFFQSILRVWGPQKTKPFKLPRMANCCGITEADSDDYYAAKDPYKMSESVISQVSNSSMSYHVGQPAQLTKIEDKEMIPLTVSRSIKKKRRSSYSKHLDGTTTLPATNGFSNGHRSNSLGNGLKDEVDANMVTTATLHMQPSAPPRPETRESHYSPSRKSMHEALYVSDGQTIRCDPYLTKRPPSCCERRQSQREKEERHQQMQSVATPVSLASYDTSVVSCPVTRNSITGTIPGNMVMASTGAIPKHSRKKSLPETAYLHQNDSSSQPYAEMSPQRSSKGSRREGRKRPRSSSSMGNILIRQNSIDLERSGDLTGEDGEVFEALPTLETKQQRPFHSLERPSSSRPQGILKHTTIDQTFLPLNRLSSESLDLDRMNGSLTPGPDRSKSSLSYRETHPHSRSTETILFHDEHDPNPIVPNKKPGTPDVWLPRTIKA